eukprot:14620283-Alexandrium_andersonii.AAC.1
MAVDALTAQSKQVLKADKQAWLQSRAQEAMCAASRNDTRTLYRIQRQVTRKHALSAQVVRLQDGSMASHPRQ